jgi:hypothetical protein
MRSTSEQLSSSTSDSVAPECFSSHQKDLQWVPEEVSNPLGDTCEAMGLIPALWHTRQPRLFHPPGYRKYVEIDGAKVREQSCSKSMPDRERPHSQSSSSWVRSSMLSSMSDPIRISAANNSYNANRNLQQDATCFLGVPHSTVLRDSNGDPSAG